MQSIASKGPCPTLYEAETGSGAQEAAGGELVRRVREESSWRVQRRSAREHGKARRNEPAAHGDSRLDPGIIDTFMGRP